MVGVTLTLACITTIFIIDKIGRKLLLVSGGIVILISIVLAAVCIYIGSNISIYFIFIYIFGYGLSLTPVYYIYVAEILPDLGVSLVVFSGWIENLVVGLIFPIIGD